MTQSCRSTVRQRHAAALIDQNGQWRGPLDDERASCANVPLLVNAAAPRSRPCLTAAFAGVGTVRDAAVVNDPDFCIIENASVSVNSDDVAGLDEQRVRRQKERQRSRNVANERQSEANLTTCGEAEAPAEPIDAEITLA